MVDNEVGYVDSRKIYEEKLVDKVSNIFPFASVFRNDKLHGNKWLVRYKNNTFEFPLINGRIRSPYPEEGYQEYSSVEEGIIKILDGKMVNAMDPVDLLVTFSGQELNDTERRILRKNYDITEISVD